MKCVQFFNKEQDDFGMPTKYYAYVVIGHEAKPGEAQKGEGIAKIYPVSAQAPVPKLNKRGNPPALPGD